MNTTVHPAEAINPQAAVSELKSAGASFTLGPWVSESQVSDGRGWDVESQTMQIWSADGETLIASYKTDYAEYPETYACNEANARLMAAAPELLSALRAILPFIPTTTALEGGASKYAENVHAADKVRAAIAKATGAQQ